MSLPPVRQQNPLSAGVIRVPKEFLVSIHSPNRRGLWIPQSNQGLLPLFNFWLVVCVESPVQLFPPLGTSPVCKIVPPDQTCDTVLQMPRQRPNHGQPSLRIAGLQFRMPFPVPGLLARSVLACCHGVSCCWRVPPPHSRGRLFSFFTRCHNRIVV